MLKLKKQASLYKLEQIVTKSKLLLCCHCNNINTLERCLLKKELFKLKLLKGVNTLLVKNKMAKRLLGKISITFQEKKNTNLLNNVNVDVLTNTSLEMEKKVELAKLFQGPTFIIGCNDLELVGPLINLINKNNKLLVLGGVLEKKIINHLDVNLLKKLDNSIFYQLLHVLESPLLNLFSTTQKNTGDLLMLLQAKEQKKRQ